MKDFPFKFVQRNFQKIPVEEPRGTRLARYKPSTEVVDLVKQLSKKLPVQEFLELYKNSKEAVKKDPQSARLQGGDYETNNSELSTLNCIINKYNPSHIEYIGRKGGSVDGILYFDKAKQEVEITSMVDKDEKIKFRNEQMYFLVGSYLNEFIEAMKKEYKCTEKKLKEILESCPPYPDDPIPFIYERIVCQLKKKTKDKFKEAYKDFWLLISYCPESPRFSCFYGAVRDCILKKIEEENRKLISSTKEVFRKIIFVPFKEGPDGKHQIFEWLVEG